MPKKRDKNPAPDAAQFIERLKTCYMGERSMRAFAEKADILPSTFRTYLRGVEPPRPSLIRIARAACVRVSWLVDGSGPREEESSRSPSMTLVPHFDLTPLRTNLRHMVSKGLDGLPTGAKEMGLSVEVLEGIIGGRHTPTIDELAVIAKAAGGFDLVLKHDLAACTLQFASQIAQGPVGEVNIVGQPAMMVTNLKHRFELHRLADDVQRLLGEAEFEYLVQEDESMVPTVENGDIVVAVRREQPAGSGLYMFSNGRRRFVATVTVTPDDRMFLSYDSTRHRVINGLELKTSGYTCIGLVVLRITRHL